MLDKLFMLHASQEQKAFKNLKSKRILIEIKRYCQKNWSPWSHFKCSNTVQFSKMLDLLPCNSVLEALESHLGYESTFYFTWFTYSFTKDNLARCTKVCSHAIETYNKEKMYVCIFWKSPTLDLIFRYFNHFVLY